MKPKTIALILCCCIFTCSRAQIQTSNQKLTARFGVLSADSENENGEKDPIYIAKLPPVQLNQPIPTGEFFVYLKDHPQGQQLASEAASLLKGKELTITLLPQHKYMITECLGLKVSAGEYSIELTEPFVRLDQNGLYLRFEIEEISNKHVTVRTRPCYKDGQCHFSKQLEISGKMSDVKLEITLNPVADLKNCKIMSLGMPHFKWRIGGVNFKPLQNNLDEMVKNMMEDGMTVASELLMPNRLAEALAAPLMKLHNCGTPEVSVKETKDNKSSTASSALWEIQANPALKGATGRIIVNAPDKGSMILHFLKPGEKNHFDAWYANKTGEFLPGYYDLKFFKLLIPNVPVEKGKDTRLKVGVLSINSTGKWKVYSKDGSEIRNGTGQYKLILPAGKYQVELLSGKMEVELKDGKIEEF